MRIPNDVPAPASATGGPAGAASRPTIEAVVQIGSVETAYLRSGSGSPVLLLLPGGARAGSPGEPLLAALACRFRVIAPDPPLAAGGAAAGPRASAPADLTTWLRDVIECLGLTTISLVVEEAFGAAALAFACIDPTRVRRLVLIGEPRASWSEHSASPPFSNAAVAQQVLAPSGHPLLLAWRDGPPAEEALTQTARVVEEFLLPGA